MLLLLAREAGVVDAAGARHTLAPLDAALLAWLALEGPTPRGRIAALLWPDRDADPARNSLRQRLFQLHKRIGRELVAGSATLSLAADVTHDLDDADTLLDGVPIEFGGEFAQWLELQRGRRGARVRRSLVELAGMAEAAKDYDDALTHAGELLALEPLSEDAHRRVMRLHYLRGDRAAALLAFDRCERVLKDEVGARPSAETLALLETIERASRDAGAVHRRLAPAALLRPPRLVGRDRQWAALVAVAHERRTAIVEGDAGMGKTRLLGDFAARDPAHAVVVGARPGDGTVPYAVLLRLVRAFVQRGVAVPRAAQRPLARLLPEFGEPFGAADEAEAARLSAALDALHAQAAASGVALVVVDDLHFADAASAEAFGRLAAGAAGEPGIAWLFGFRPAEGGLQVREIVVALRDAGRAETIALPPLDVAQVAELIDSLCVAGLDGAALAPRLVRHSGGNPLYLLETLKSMRADGSVGREAPLPAAAGVAQLVALRIGRLSADAVKLARCAAVAGQDFSSELATHLLGARPLDLADAWAELESAQVLREQAFAHDLIRDAALASVPPPLARQLHGQIADFLGAQAVAPERIAAHALASARPLQAVPHLLAAGLRASTALRWAESAAALTRAADLLESDGRPGEASDALARYFQGTVPGWDEATQAIVDRMEALADTPLRRARAGQYRADILARAGDFAGSGAAAQAALKLVDPATQPVLAAELMNFTIAAQIQSGDLGGAVQVMYRAVAIAEKSGSDDCLATITSTLGSALDWAGRHAEAEPHHARALELRKRQAAPQSQIAVAMGYAGNRVEVGRLDEARALFDYAARVGASHDFDIDEEWPNGAAQRARLALDLGDYSDALHRYERAHELFTRRAPHFLVGVVCGITTLWMRLGQWARAHRSSREALALADGAVPVYAARARQLAAEVDAGMGPGAGLLAALDATQPLAERAGPRAIRQLSMARVLLLPPDEGLALALRVRDAARAEGAAGLVLDAEVRAAQAARRGGDAEEAARHARAALALFDEVEPYLVYRAEVWLAAAQALHGAGDARADEVAATAAQWIRETAARRVPAEFRDGFVERNPINRELLALAARRST